jgi:hypothetical protein
MSQQQKKIHLLPFLHILACLVLAMVGYIYLWHHSPSRDLFRLQAPTRGAATHGNDIPRNGQGPARP